MFCNKCGGQVDQSKDLCPNCNQPWRSTVTTVAKKTFGDVVGYICFFPITILCLFTLIIFFIVMENFGITVAACAGPILLVLFFVNKYFSKRSEKSTRFFDMTTMVIGFTAIVLLFVSMILFIVANAAIVAP